jgi:NTP pyrophosphatase (non-canonical NTP hydrolase)
MSAPTWQDEAWAVHLTVIKRWEPASDEDKHFIALAMAGEVGEALNLIKKDWRGDAGDRSGKLALELADIRIYLELLARCYGVDLDKACATKMDELLARWPECRPVVERLRAGGLP